MNKFSDLGITAESKAFTGDKIKIERVLNREIVIHEFKIEPSKLDGNKGNGFCLYLQISIGDIKYLIMTGSGYLQEMIKKVPQDKFPITTTIVKDNERYIFT